MWNEWFGVGGTLSAPVDTSSSLGVSMNSCVFAEEVPAYLNVAHLAAEAAACYQNIKQTMKVSFVSLWALRTEDY